MIVVDTLEGMRERSSRLRDGGNRIGFVPTMGYLHAGHASLMRRARAESHAVVVSVFVNPTQFGPNEDFAAYPRDLARDEAICREAGVDVLFTPRAEEMYRPETATTVHVARLTEGLCGASRPGHFDGVTTVVAKLFHLVAPHRAYFGLKDYQQYRVISRMVEDLDMPVAVVGCPTVREADGLALSSRNKYLDPAQRSSALSLSRALAAAREAAAAGRRGRAEVLAAARSAIEAAPGTRIDYVELVHPLTLEPVPQVAGEGALLALAVFVGKTRLIDNTILEAD